jgi:hypothetical protein
MQSHFSITVLQSLWEKVKTLVKTEDLAKFYIIWDEISCYRQCSDPLDCSNCYAKSSAIEMKINRVWPSRPVTKSGRRETASVAESRGQGSELGRRQETLLAIYRASSSSLYRSTREAVLRLKRPIRGIDRSHSDSEIDQSIMMDTKYIKG